MNREYVIFNFKLVIVIVLITMTYIPWIPVSMAKPSCSTADPIIVTERKEIDFGEITVGFMGGTIDTNGNVTGDVAEFKSNIVKGKVNIEACKGKTVYISYTDGTLVYNGQTMTVRVLNSPGPEFMTKRKITLEIEAMLTAGPLQAVGDYSGTYSIIVTY